MNLKRIHEFVFAPVEHDYTFRDSILYALSLGYGSDTLDTRHLQFVYEQGQKVVPSMCVVLAYPGFWLRDPDLDCDWIRLLHGEHRFEIHGLLKPEGKVRAQHRITAVDDKGSDKGAALYLEKSLFDEAGQTLATIRQTLFLRGDGGSGGFGKVPQAPLPLPGGLPDRTVDLETSPQSALIYRLTGDMNPVHADPEVAKAAGFDRPVLMGLCTMGLATRVVLEHFCDAQPERLRSLFVRFSKPVFPGEDIRFEFYRDGPRVRFRARCIQRDVIVLDRCEAEFTS
jgi:acyl dehydratase